MGNSLIDGGSTERHVSDLEGYAVKRIELVTPTRTGPIHGISPPTPSLNSHFRWEPQDENRRFRTWLVPWLAGDTALVLSVDGWSVSLTAPLPIGEERRASVRIDRTDDALYPGPNAGAPEGRGVGYTLVVQSVSFADYLRAVGNLTSGRASPY